MTDKRNHYLYRKDYFTAQITRVEDQILIPPNLGFMVSAISSLILVVAIFIFFVEGSYTKKARLEGVVMPSGGLVKVFAQDQGMVDTLFIKEGDLVQVGQPLYRLNGERYDGNGRPLLASLELSLQSQAKMLEEQIAREQSSNEMQQRGLTRRIMQLQDEVLSAEEALKLVKRQMQLNKDVVDSYRKLIAKHYVSEYEHQQKQIELLTSKANIEAQRQAIQRLRREQVTAENEIRTLQEQAASRRVELERDLQGIKQQQIDLYGQRDNHYSTCFRTCGCNNSKGWANCYSE